MPDAPPPGSTPTGYQRTQGGGVKWVPPTAEHLSKLLPQYDIECILGYGGMGAVYKGKQKSLDRTVAIKILPPGLEDEDASYVDRFKNEAKVMAKFMHPAIVGVFDFGETSEGQLYIVMEFVDGTDVQKMLQAQGRLPAEHALAITAHVCDALKYAHDHGVIHRDIKPANILINLEGAVKVADFGLAKAEEHGASGITKTGMAMGTPDFVAPEALVMGTEVDGRADLYAVGVMLYNMLTGNVPRGAFKPASVMIPGIDPRFDGIVQKAMQMDREERYQSAKEIRRDLDVILTTPLMQAGGKASAAIPQQSLPQKPIAKGPQKPMGKSANVPVRQGAAASDPDPNHQSQIVNHKSKTPLFIGTGAVAAIAVGAFVMLGSGSRKTSDAHSPATASAKSPDQTRVSSATPSSTPIKVREEPKATGASASTKPTPSVANDPHPLRETEKRKPASTVSTPVKSSESKDSEEMKPARAAASTVPTNDAEKTASSPAPSPLPPQEPINYAFPLPVPKRPTQAGQIHVWRLDGKPLDDADKIILPPEELIDVVQVAAFPTRSKDAPVAYHALALRADGSVRSWGKDTAGNTKVPETLKDVVRVAAAGSRSGVITSSGEFVHIGIANGKDLSKTKRPGEQVVAMFMGDGFDLLLFSSGVAQGCRLQNPADDIAMATLGPFAGIARAPDLVAGILPSGEIMRLGHDRKPSKPEPFLRAPFTDIQLLPPASHAVAIATDGMRVVGVQPLDRAADFAGMSAIATSGPIIAGRVGADAWKFFPDADIDKDYCEQRAKGCFAITLTDKYVFGLKPADPELIAAARRKVAVGMEPPPPVAAPALAAPQTELEKRLATLEEQFQAAAERDAGKAFKDALATLNKGYVGALDRILATTMQAGHTDEALKIREEKQRIEKNEGVSMTDEEGTPATITKARATYRDAFLKLEAEKNKKLVPLYGFYDKALDALRVELTKAGKLDDAQKVMEVKTQITARKEGKTLAAPAPSSATATAAAQGKEPSKTESKRPAKTPTVRPNPALSRKAAELALSKGANVNLWLRNTKVPVRAGDELPKGSWELRDINYPSGKPTPITDDDVAVYTQAVELQNFNTGDRSVNSIATLTHFKNTPLLANLNIAGYGKVTEADCETIGSLHELKSLQLPGTAPIANFKKLIGGLELNTVSFNGRKLKPEDYDELGRHSLTNLTLNGVSDDALQHLGSLERLVVFSASGSRLTEVGIGALNSKLSKTLTNINCGNPSGDSSGATKETISKFASLEDMQIRGKISADAISRIGELRALKRIVFYQAEITPAHIAAIARCKLAEDLKIGNGALTAADISELKKLKTLTTLTLQDNGITIDASALAALPELKHLKELGLPESQVTGDQAEALRKQMPKCSISLVKPYP